MEALLAQFLGSLQDPVTWLLVIAIYHLKRDGEARERELKAELGECRQNHLDCERKNLLLAGAIEDVAEGRNHSALAKAQTVTDAAKKEVTGT